VEAVAAAGLGKTFIFSLIMDILIEFIFQFLLLPVFAVIATPWILIRNIFRKGTYLENVKKSYLKVFHYWKKSVV